MNLEHFLTRRQARTPCRRWIKAALGGFLGVAFVGWLGHISGVAMLIAPFGASCVLLFGFPETPLSQPVNTIFGHMVATAIALGLRTVLPGEWWAIGIAVGLTILVMAALRISHPPAGADPVVVFLTDPGFGFLVTPVLVGAVTLATIAVLFHRLPPRAQYPLGD